jgi:hypothetical protein
MPWMQLVCEGAFALDTQLGARLLSSLAAGACFPGVCSTRMSGCMHMLGNDNNTHTIGRSANFGCVEGLCCVCYSM